MTAVIPRVVPGGPTDSLWPKVVARRAIALASGALVPIGTVEAVIEDAGIPFLVRVASGLERKPQSLLAGDRAGPAPRDPFLPYDVALFVADVSATHVALLNRFPVIAHHLLVVTRAFADQEDWIDRDDFAALASCLGAIPGLGFYNGGAAAGASQPHKHLQFVPLPLGTATAGLPVDAIIEGTRGAPGPVRLPAFDFPHALCWLPDIDWRDGPSAAAALAMAYAGLLAATGLAPPSGPAGTRQSAPYNLLVTRQWMLVVPRRCERFGSLAINALGFAGALLVRDDDGFAAVRTAGPLAVLRAVAA